MWARAPVFLRLRVVNTLAPDPHTHNTNPSFNNEQTMVDGLWAGQSSLTLDFSTVAYRQALLGFNAVRLPFSFRDFQKPGRFYWPCRIASEDEIRKSVTPPGVGGWGVCGCVGCFCACAARASCSKSDAPVRARALMRTH